MIIMAAPYRNDNINPYASLLYGAISAEPGVEVREYSLLSSWRQSADLIHVHWPDIFTRTKRSWLRPTIKTLLFCFSILVFRARGIPIVWTVHNLEPHESPYPLLNDLIWKVFLPGVSGSLHLSESGCRDALERYPQLRQRPHGVTPQGDYRFLRLDGVTRAGAREELGYAPDHKLVVSAGLIRRYKNIPDLIHAFRGIGDANARLLICGSPEPSDLAAEITEAAADDTRIKLLLRRVDDRELALAMTAADLMVLPYQRIHNSGAAVLALSFERPVLVRDCGSTRELHSAVGGEWVDLLDEQPLDTARLEKALRWSDNPRPPQLDLGQYEWHRVAARTLAFYRSLGA